MYETSMVHYHHHHRQGGRRLLDSVQQNVDKCKWIVESAHNGLKSPLCHVDRVSSSSGEFLAGPEKQVKYRNQLQRILL